MLGTGSGNHPGPRDRSQQRRDRRSTITVTNQDTGIKTTTNTNEAGNYVVRGLAFGRYEVECEARGFRKYVGKDNSVNVAQTLTLDIAMQVGAVEQTVEVSGAAPLVESSTSDLGTVVDQKQVADLPLSVSGNVRNPESFVFLAPGVTATPPILRSMAPRTAPRRCWWMESSPRGRRAGARLGLTRRWKRSASSNFWPRTSGGIWQDGRRVRNLHDEERHQSISRVGVRIPAQRQVRCARLYLADTPVNRQNEFGANFGGPVILPKYNGRTERSSTWCTMAFRYRAGATNQLLTLPNAAQRGGDFSGLTKGGRRWRSTTPIHRVRTAPVVLRAMSSRARAFR
jgi:hypothetical protein